MSRVLIYSDTSNNIFSDIAITFGFKIGVQVPDAWRKSKSHIPIYFTDQNWKNPNRPGYIKHVARLRPNLATVIDWEREEQFAEVMDWAEEVAQYAERIIIIPKVAGQLHRIPERINGKEVVLGYSVPTKFGGTPVPIWEFEQRPVHLLGGRPNKQMQLTYYMNVVSVDGNMMGKMATMYTAYWVPEWQKVNGEHGFIVLEQEITESRRTTAFTRSCKNVWDAWQRIVQMPQ